MRRIVRAAAALLPAALFAQLTPEQRDSDFRNLAALFAKRYAPSDWKVQAFGVNLFDIGPWLDRVRNAKDDLEFYEIETEYVASLQDTHTYVRLPSNFPARLGFTVDLYDGKALIDGIERGLLPASQYRFQVGDELVSLDGRSSQEWIAHLSRFRRLGCEAATKRTAAGQITARSQNTIPRTGELGATATVEIQRHDGALESYTIPWIKNGFPLINAGPVPSPKAAVRRHADAPEYLRVLHDLHNWSVAPDDPLLEEPRRYVLGYGSRDPVFRAGLPIDFVQRLGRNGGDYHFSGVFEAEGMRIGFLRFPGFSPSGTTGAIVELEAEIQYLQQTTDGLVVDVTRNTGGGCYMLDAAARLIPNTFVSFGEKIRVTVDRINGMQTSLEQARAQRAPAEIIATLEDYVRQLQQAYSENRGLTATMPACTMTGRNLPPRFENEPATVVYQKPLIVLIDEFSTSAGDIFPSILQDNARGPLVGARTNGAGGSVTTFPAGFYSETSSSNTNTLVCRRNALATPDYPMAEYIENIGVRPDIPLDYMTRENLVNGGRPFVEAFTRIIVEQIRAKR